MWTGAIDASLTGLEGICRSPIMEHFVWCLPVGQTTSQRLLSNDNQSRYLTTNDLELANYVAHIHIFAPLMDTLEHIFTKADNTAAEIWARRSSVSSATAVRLLLREAMWICHQR